MVTRVVRDDGKNASNIFVPMNLFKKQRDDKEMMVTRVERSDGNRGGKK